MVAEDERTVQVAEAVARAAKPSTWVDDWREEQKQDPLLGTVMRWLSEGKHEDLNRLMGTQVDTDEGKALLRNRGRLVLDHGKLYFKWNLG